jgi:hypothetical protein
MLGSLVDPLPESKSSDNGSELGAVTCLRYDFVIRTAGFKSKSIGAKGMKVHRRGRVSAKGSWRNVGWRGLWAIDKGTACTGIFIAVLDTGATYVDEELYYLS